MTLSDFEFDMQNPSRVRFADDQPIRIDKITSWMGGSHNQIHTQTEKWKKNPFWSELDRWPIGMNYIYIIGSACLTLYFISVDFYSNHLCFCIFIIFQYSTLFYSIYALTNLPFQSSLSNIHASSWNFGDIFNSTWMEDGIFYLESTILWKEVFVLHTNPPIYIHT